MGMAGRGRQEVQGQQMRHEGTRYYAMKFTLTEGTTYSTVMPYHYNAMSSSEKEWEDNILPVP